MRAGKRSRRDGPKLPRRGTVALTIPSTTRPWNANHAVRVDDGVAEADVAQRGCAAARCGCGLCNSAVGLFQAPPRLGRHPQRPWRSLRPTCPSARTTCAPHPGTPRGLRARRVLGHSQHASYRLGSVTAPRLRPPIHGSLGGRARRAQNPASTSTRPRSSLPWRYRTQFSVTRAARKGWAITGELATWGVMMQFDRVQRGCPPENSGSVTSSAAPPIRRPGGRPPGRR